MVSDRPRPMAMRLRGIRGIRGYWSLRGLRGLWGALGTRMAIELKTPGKPADTASLPAWKHKRVAENVMHPPNSPPLAVDAIQGRSKKALVDMIMVRFRGACPIRPAGLEVEGGRLPTAGAGAGAGDLLLAAGEVDLAALQ